MKRRIVCVMLSMAIAFSGVVDVRAAENVDDQQEMILEAEAGIARQERSSTNNLLADQISGLFATFGDKTISQTTDKNYNHTLTIPDGIVVNSNVSVEMLMQNMASMGITSQVGNAYQMNFNLGSDYALDAYLGEVKDFGQAAISGKIGGVSYNYQVNGTKSGGATVIRATTTNAAAAVSELEKHLQNCTGEAGVAANGFKIERGGYIEVGNDRLEFNPNYEGELIVGSGDIAFGEYETDIRDYFLYKKGEASGANQISLFLPKNSYLSLGGKSVRVTEDVLVEINGLADGYDILDASDATILQKLFEARTGSELLVAMLQTTNQIAKSADGRNITVDVRFPSLTEASEIKLDATQITLNAGESKQLNVTVLPENAYDKTVTWTSSNPEVATVVNGKITGLKPGTAIITATTANGLKAECSVTIGLAKPKGLKVYNGNVNATKLKLSWNAVTGADKYEIYRSKKKNGSYKKVATVKKTSYLDKKLTTGTRYYYKIKAVTGSVSSDFSAVKGRKPRLKAPQLKVKARAGAAKLTWRKLTYADGYHIYMKTKKNGKFQRIVKLQKSSYRKSGLKSGRTYYFRVRGYRVVKGKKYYGFYSDTVKVKVK